MEEQLLLSIISFAKPEYIAFITIARPLPVITLNRTGCFSRKVFWLRTNLETSTTSIAIGLLPPTSIIRVFCLPSYIYLANHGRLKKVQYMLWDSALLYRFSYYTYKLTSVLTLCMSHIPGMSFSRERNCNMLTKSKNLGLEVWGIVGGGGNNYSFQFT